jgi:hypothetical protein
MELESKISISILCGLMNKRRKNGNIERSKYHHHTFYWMIINGKRATGDLNILCANCNQLYRYGL